VNEAHNASLDGSHPITLQTKMLRLELLNVKADLEREMETSCGLDVHWVVGLGASLIANRHGKEC